MTVVYTGDRCPACGSDETTPYAVIVGATETYGYQCLACSVTWPVLHHAPVTAALLPATSRRATA